MKLDDLKQDWQQNIATDSTADNLEEVISMLEKEAAQIDKEVKRRDILEISISLLLIPCWIYGLVNSTSTMQIAGFCLAIMACLYIPYKLVVAKQVEPQKSDNVRAFLLNEKQKNSQQKQLLESIVWWYITPLMTAILLITLGGSVNEAGIPSISSSLSFYYGILAILIVCIYFTNKRAAKKKFTPLLENIEQRLAELSN